MYHSHNTKHVHTPLGTANIDPYFLDAGLPECFDDWVGLNNNAVGKLNIFSGDFFFNFTRLDGKGGSVFIFAK